MSQAQASLRRIIEAAPLAITLLDARTLQACCRSTPSPRRRSGRTPGRRCSADARGDASAGDLAARAPRRHAGGAAATRGDDSASTASSRDGASSVWDARYLPLAAGRASRPTSCCWSPPTSPSSARRRRRGSRRRSRSARCWSRKCTTASRTTCRAWPACCSRSRSASPRSPGAIAEVVGQVQAIAQVYGLQVGASGPLPMRRAWCEAITALGAAHLRPADPLSRRRRERRASGCCPRPSRSRSR